MPKKSHARRYARAVFEIALEKNELERWQADLQKLTGLTADSTFLAALESPKIKFDIKSDLLAKRLGDISPLALNLARLLIVRNGVNMIGEIAAEYRRLVDIYHGVQTADIVTAVPVDEKEKKKLAESLGALVGARITIKDRVDPAIIGGIIARVDGKLLDGSTRSQLAALKRQLVG